MRPCAWLQCRSVRDTPEVCASWTSCVGYCWDWVSWRSGASGCGRRAAPARRRETRNCASRPSRRCTRAEQRAVRPRRRLPERPADGATRAGAARVGRIPARAVEHSNGGFRGRACARSAHARRMPIRSISVWMRAAPAVPRAAFERTIDGRPHGRGAAQPRAGGGVRVRRHAPEAVAAGAADRGAADRGAAAAEAASP